MIQHRVISTNRTLRDWTYEYVKYPSWEEACAALEASKVDLLPMVYYTEDRERRMIFSASSLCEISATLNVRLDDTRYAYEDFKTFSGMRVGVIANSQDAEAFAQLQREERLFGGYRGLQRYRRPG